MRQQPIHFYDSASPQNIASGVHAAVCINGDFAWRESDIRRMEAVFRYIVKEADPSWAAHARGVDIEPGCVWPPQEAIPFLIARHKHYGDATAYCDRSVLPEVQDLVKKAGIVVFHWVSTLDGTQEVPGAWAVQYADVHNLYDVSVLHGVNNLHKP